jgi:hypothetical protein
VAARNVAEALADMVNGAEPERRSNGAAIPEIGGPRAETLPEMVRLLISRRGEPMQVEEVTNPADPDHELLENGALLPGPDATLAGPTFGEWLRTQG